MKRVSLSNGIGIELLVKGDKFVGLGKVTASGTVLRSGKKPMSPEIRSPDGVELFDYRVRRLEATPDGISVELTASRREGGLMEWMVHSVRNRRNLADWTDKPRPADGTLLRLEIRPVTRRLGEIDCAGFSYQYVYSSPDIPIYKILDRGTWEIGGRATGNEFWMRNCFTPSMVSIASAEQFHSTEWFIPDCANPNVFQFLPLQTELQGFSFTGNRRGTLLTWATEVAHVRSLFEKPRGKDVLVHWHEHCGDLALEFRAPVMEVLWAPGRRDKIGQANLYEQMKELVHETLHSQLGMRRERVTTYGQIEEWTLPDMTRYAEVGLPKLLDAGLKTVGLASHFQHNMNTFGVSNMCCTVDYKVAETVGEDKLREFCRRAKAGGAAVEMWGNTSISSLSHIFNMRNAPEQRVRFLPKEGSIMEALEKTPNAFVRNPSNAIEADHYTPVFCVLNLRDPAVREYWNKSWKYASESVGLGGIFLDSSFNLSSDKFHYVQNSEAGRSGATADQIHLVGHYRGAQDTPKVILSQYRAHLELMRDMQEYGYVYGNEDLGVFGIHRHGPGIQARLDSLFMWSDCICNFDVPSIQKAGADPDDVFFRGLAYRQMWSVVWDIKGDALSFNYYGLRGEFDRPQAWHLALLKVYNEANDLMRNREILPRERGVLYRAGGKQVLWAFADFKLPLGAETPVQDVLAGSTTAVTELRAAKHRVYVIG